MTPQRAAATGLLCLCLPVAACSLRSNTFTLPPLEATKRDAAHPGRVGVIVDKAFTPYKITFRYWSTTPYTWALNGLPDAYVATLSLYFLSVEPLPVDRNPSARRHDFIARMSVDQLHFDGANTTGRRDRVDLTMTFTIAKPDGAEVFRTTVSGNGSSPYRQPCRLCKPDPREAFTEAFGTAFAQLSNMLSAADLQLVR